MKDDSLLQFQNASISNGTSLVLDEVNIRLGKAEFCYIIGKTGSGKSSFLKTIYAENKLLSGVGNVLDYELNNIKRDEVPKLRRKMGMIFQQFQLFHQWTVGRNLAYVLSVTDWSDKKKIRNRIEEVLSSVGLENKIKEHVHNLSGGEQQRVAIARAILNEPKIIIADEPTGNLDPDTSDSILFLLRDIALQNSAAVIVATHDQRIINKFPARIFRCFDKKMKEVM